MAAKKQAQQSAVVIELPAPNIQEMTLTIVGDSSLICHRWSEKARKAMLDKQMKRAVVAKEAKNPEEDYRASLYPFPGGGYGFPSVAFKSAAVDACSHIAGVTKVEARGAFHIIGELVKIDGEPSMREDMVRIGLGVADIRHRGEFREWRATIRMRFNANSLSAEQITNMFSTAGFSIGVGEWRPQRDGSFGMFHIASGSEKSAKKQRAR